MQYRLKLGLEVHAQLFANQKLFSLARPKFQALPNSQVAYFDAALPGTQPKLSLQCLRLALRAGLALNSQIASTFSFDRKHYMYPDQPSGYQITQFREPVASHGYLDLLPRDIPQFAKKMLLKDGKKRIRIQQIQMEQDTGKTSYIEQLSLVDLNRANTGLIELVTLPDFESEIEAIAFIRKLQLLLRKLKVCSGDMETGAMRVDVNVSVTDDAGRDLSERCEIKNLFSTSAVKYAILAEYSRQCKALHRGETITKETRGWDGKKTWKIRDKESALDYRYMPDPDIPSYTLPSSVVNQVAKSLPELPDSILDKLLAKSVQLVDAKTLLDLDGGAEFCLAACDKFESSGGVNLKLVSTWLVHRWLGQATELPDLNQFVDLILTVDQRRISTTSAKLILKHISQGYSGSLDNIITEYGLESDNDVDELKSICKEVVTNHPDVVAKILKGKKASLAFLLGQVMKETQGTFKPNEVKEALVQLIDC